MRDGRLTDAHYGVHFEYRGRERVVVEGGGKGMEDQRRGAEHAWRLLAL